MEEKTKILDEAIEDIKEKFKEMEDASRTREDQDTNKGKWKVKLEDEIAKPNSPLGE